MSSGRVVFNKRDRWDWLDDGCDIGEDKLKQEEWFAGDTYYPPDFEYNTPTHDHQITEWLSKPGGLVRYERGR